MHKALLLLLLLPASAFSDSLVTAQLSASWSDPIFTTTGSLTTEDIEWGLITPAQSMDLLLDFSEPDTNGLERGHFRRAFWYYAEGSGTIVASIPYSMAVTCREDSVGSAWLKLSMGFGREAIASLGCNETHQGVLTVAQSMSDPWGLLVSIGVSGEIQAHARVPEASAALMLIIALLASLVFYRY